GLLGRLFAVENLQCQRHTGPTDGARIGDSGPDEALDVEQLVDEAGIVGADHRDQRRTGFHQGVDNDVVDAGGPDAVERNAGGDVVEDLLLALILLPTGIGLLGDVHARILLQRPLEATVAVAVGRSAGGTAHIDHVALAADLLEQPLGPKIRILLLVVLQDPGAGLGDVLVDDHHDDPLGAGLGERRLDAGGV